MENLPWGTNSQLKNEQFYNRTHDINHLKNLLETTRNATPPTIMLSGIRGVGKTALLKKIKNELDGNYLVNYIDLSHSYNYQTANLDELTLMQYFYKSWIETTKEKKFNRISKRINEYFKRKNFKFKKLIEFGGIPIPIFESEDNLETFMNLVLELPQKIYEENKENIDGVIVMIDEFQALKDLGKNLDKFLWYFRSVIQSQSNVAYVFSGSMTSKDLIIEKIASQKGAFGGRVLSFEIEPFTKDTVKSYLNERLPNLILDDGGFERFYNCTRGVPYYVNTFANLLQKNTSLTDQDVKEEFQRVIPLLADHFKQKWGGLNLTEQKIVTAIIEGHEKRKDLAKHLQRTSGSLGIPLLKLQNTGFIQNVSKGTYEITELILKIWLEQEYKMKGVFPYIS
jgi:AAA+ ATPase superfamily predicted ATPase